MRGTTQNLVKYYVKELGLRGRVLEIGGHKLERCAAPLFDGLEYFDLDLKKSDNPNTIIGDISDCKDTIEDGSFDVVFSSDVFEHVAQPWKAAGEIQRILKPGGVAFTITLWSWRNHPCPIDYWRFSPECLEFLYPELTCLEKGYDLSQRRNDQPGFWKTGMDSVPVDELGGWREHWAVYHIGIKGRPRNRLPKPFKETEDPKARFLRQDTQGRVTRSGKQEVALTGSVRFCMHCGESLRSRECKKCRTMMLPGSKFCSQCGTPANQVAEVPEPKK